MNFKTIEWKNNTVVMLDQRKLPTEEVYVTCRTAEEVAEAIKMMVIRGAPAIGVAGAMGLALGALEIKTVNPDDFVRQLQAKADMLFKTRPTAVNLQWGLERMKNSCRGAVTAPGRGNPAPTIQQLKNILVTEAQKILEEDITTNRSLGFHGEKLINDGDRVLTHCNAGALACGGFGTALGVLYAAQEKGKKFAVFADETRPFLQGSRLTAWELQKNNIPVTLITDNMAGWMMKKGEIKKVIVGADRIAANGDTANKIGTYSVAILAREHKIPFYVAAPFSTIDFKIKSGIEIPIEERSLLEVTQLFSGKTIAPEGIQIKNPAFDVTPHPLITAIITEKGIIEKPFEENLKKYYC